MKALDTNVLIRFLVKDDKQQAGIVYRLFKKAEEKGEVFWVPLLVVLEVIWVLESVYQVPREEILDCIDDFLRMPILKFESQTSINAFVLSSRKSRIDLSDLLIAHSAEGAGCDSVLTFDRRASGYHTFKLIKV